MVSVVLGMLVCLGFALVVMALVAVPARRQGREVLTERGEEVLESIRDELPEVLHRRIVLVDGREPGCYSLRELRSAAAADARSACMQPTATASSPI